MEYYTGVKKICIVIQVKFPIWVDSGSLSRAKDRLTKTPTPTMRIPLLNYGLQLFKRPLKHCRLLPLSLVFPSRGGGYASTTAEASTAEDTMYFGHRARSVLS